MKIFKKTNQRVKQQTMTTVKLRIIYLLVAMFSICSCIEEYIPEINRKDINEYVVTGKITNEEGFHTIFVSKASPLSNPMFNPVSGCIVEVYDDNDNTFTFEDQSNGEYIAWIDQDYLDVGTSYKLKVITPDEMVLESDFSEMPNAPSLDSIYYIREKPEYIDPVFDNTEGIRFYLDFSGNEDDSRFLRWEVTETFEYHTYNLLYVIIDRRGRHYMDIEDKSKSVCWKTETLSSYYPLSTSLFSANSYTKLPLHYVDNHTERLLYGYYLKVDQLAIDENAYQYWKQVENNTNQTGGLYEKQPLPLQGNIQNITHPDQKVLGYFEVASVNSKTLFIKDFVMKWAIEECPLRDPDIRRPFPWWSSSPLYITYVEGRMYYMGEACWNCLKMGGENVKPEFWPVQ